MIVKRYHHDSMKFWVGKHLPAERRRIAERVKRARGMQNSELLEHTLYLATGDREDGDFTPGGEVEFVLIQAHLRHRLRNWLKK